MEKKIQKIKNQSSGKMGGKMKERRGKGRCREWTWMGKREGGLEKGGKDDGEMGKDGKRGRSRGWRKKEERIERGESMGGNEPLAPPLSI